MPDLRYDITFTGRVQGVNFRWITCQAAGKYEVSGWVRNEPDGSVRCLVEGDAHELDRFVQTVQAAMTGFIRDTRIRESAAVGDQEGFRIA